MLRSRKIKLSLISSVLSLVALTLLIGLTSPIDNVSFGVGFFGGGFWLLVSLGHLLIYVRRGKLGPKSRGRIVIFSVFLVLVMMFSSSQSLNWVDGLILLLVLAGLLFYSSRRDKRR
jgi:peptidoglycan/LPS O-acetylase OafA/YrhL